MSSPADPSLPRAERAQIPTRRGAAFGTVQPVFDDAWWAWGTTRFAPGATFPRNMIILREDDGLVVVHPVMLPEAEQAKVEALGPVRHIVRLGDYHGMDDALYVGRYHPQVWAPAGATSLAGVTVDHELIPGGPLPLADGTLLRFERSSAPELVLHLARHDGLLLTCDSIQNWHTWPDGCSFLGRIMARVMGFRGRACLGPGWRRGCEPKDGIGFGPAYREILALDFKHLLSAHGPPVLDTAHADLQAAVDSLYPAA